jgi:hypothetical protein
VFALRHCQWRAAIRKFQNFTFITLIINNIIIIIIILKKTELPRPNGELLGELD